MKHFKDKVAAITGAGSGIGRGLAILLAQQGCHLALSDINAQTLEETVSLLKAYPVTVTSDIVNVANKEQVYAWADKVQQAHQRVNLIFNNAGIAMGNTVESHTLEDYEAMMGINFWGVVYGTKAFLPYLKASGDGHIINISSLFGLVSQPSQSAYNAAKFAVRGFTESLRQELDIMKIGVSATCVHPGGIKTNIARDAKICERVADIGMSAKANKQFEKVLRMPPQDAAHIILEAVKDDKRRVLVGIDAKGLDLVQRILPTGYQMFVVNAVKGMKSLQARYRRKLA